MAGSLLSAVGFEKVQEWSGYIPGDFSGSDIAVDMAGGALAVSVEAYFDHKIGLVDAISRVGSKLSE